MFQIQQLSRTQLIGLLALCIALLLLSFWARLTVSDMAYNMPILADDLWKLWVGSKWVQGMLGFMSVALGAWIWVESV